MTKEEWINLESGDIIEYQLLTTGSTIFIIQYPVNGSYNKVESSQDKEFWTWCGISQNAAKQVDNPLLVNEIVETNLNRDYTTWKLLSKVSAPLPPESRFTRISHD